MLPFSHVALKMVSTFISVWFLGTTISKDMRMDAVFPPVVQPSDSGLPDGHLLPLGCQREPDGPVKEYAEPLTPIEFWNLHVKDYVPLVYRQAITKAPAATNWQSDEYIREKYGDLDVLVETKNEDRGTRPQRMTLNNFLDNYKRKDWYVVSLMPDPMRADMQVPRSLLCGTFKKTILESNLWLSAGGTKSLLHYDADHNLHCLMSGRKDFIMIDPKYDDLLVMNEKRRYSGSSWSHLDMNRIDLLAHPQVSEVPWTWATLLAGDCIFIPAGYFHQVRSYGRSVATTIMWAPLNKFNDSDCATADIAAYTSLSDVQLQWTYKKGDKSIDMGFVNVEVELRGHLLDLMAERNKTKLTKELFTVFYQRIVVDEDQDGGDIDEEDLEVIDKMFGVLDINKTGYLTRQGLENLDIEVLKDVARILDEPHGPVKENDDVSTRDEL
ncbi:bifunctional peptidase and (3S)-lysyl hydroxylase Jmjd7-like [Branchiostoma lanceolatum]|uniref:bifunctional peptidase and (3S)-lysyl hydroxylase Jmjd7-like n=1 Tax=Branchiostoma lanceolatum TaxID=7740 RepID=UPI0034565F59